MASPTPSSTRNAISIPRPVANPISPCAIDQSVNAAAYSQRRFTRSASSAHRDLQQRVRPEERRQQHALGLRAEVQFLGDQRQREGNRGAIEVVDERRREEQADDRPSARIGEPEWRHLKSTEMRRGWSSRRSQVRGAYRGSAEERQQFVASVGRQRFVVTAADRRSG